MAKHVPVIESGILWLDRKSLEKFTATHPPIAPAAWASCDCPAGNIDCTKVAVVAHQAKGYATFALRCLSCWEESKKGDWVDVDKDGTTDRLPVPGGWLYRTIIENPELEDAEPSVATTFVPEGGQVRFSSNTPHPEEE